jgi:nucleotide-binding universal stress UspA family protein
MEGEQAAALHLRDVLVAVDGSVHADLALTQGIALAQRHHARLTVMAVAGHVTAATWGAAVDGPALQAEVDREMERILRRAVDRVPDDLPVCRVLAHGHAGPAIIHQIHKGNHDAVVVGARGLGRVGQLFGSVSRHVLHHADIAVFLAHAPVTRSHRD